MIRLFGWLKVPMIGYVRPKLLHVDGERVDVMIPLRRRTKNHLNSMYFGALSVGADVAAGYLAMRRIQSAGRPVSFVFQDVHGEFLRRPTGDVRFRCADGQMVQRIIDQTLLDGERHAATVAVVCTVPSESEALVARFRLTLSVKARK